MVGLVGPLGTDLDMVITALKRAFRTVNYHVHEVPLIEEVLKLPRWRNLPSSPVDRKYESRMNAGDEFRAMAKRDDAIALLALAAITEKRAKYHSARRPYRELPAAIPRSAYVLRSLKTPQEIETLRYAYGPNFLCVSVYLSRNQRRDWLVDRIASSQMVPDKTRYRSRAEGLIERDQFGAVTYGQNVRDTFPMADVFVDASDPVSASADILRFVELIFGHPVRTPRRAEAAMFHAYGAKLRSSSPGRQVGAAICTPDGALVAVGTNEVAEAHGGQYWADGEDDYDFRDHRRAHDAHAEMTKTLMNDFLCRLRRKGWLKPQLQSLEPEKLLERAEKTLVKGFDRKSLRSDDPPTLSEKIQIDKVIEFLRPVHAEMAALVDCARRGVPVDGCVMYVTTFPCHECARLIVASGISAVFFIEPYPKSRVVEMFDDSIAVDSQGDSHHIGFRAYTGVAPRRYVSVFDFTDTAGSEFADFFPRKQKGAWIDWEQVRGDREPRFTDSGAAIQGREADVLDQFNKLMRQVKASSRNS